MLQNGYFLLKIKYLCLYIFVCYILEMAKNQYNRIKAILAEEGKTNKDLAELLGLSVQTISRWCTNKRQPSVQMLFEIAKALKVNVRELLIPTQK